MTYSARILIMLSLLMVSCKSLDESTLPDTPGTNKELMLTSIPDPIEPFNRASFAVDAFLFNNIYNPVTNAYNYVVPETGRKGLRNFYENISYPVRLTSNLLQGKFDNAWHETKRFGINTTVGVLGFRNSAADKYHMYPYNEDLGQTFGYWGWDHKYYLYVPFFGPGSVRDYLGATADFYLRPTSYFPPATHALIYNDFSFYNKAIHDILAKEYDPYELTKVAYSVKREFEVNDYTFDPNKEDTAQVQTLRSIFAAPSDDTFIDKAVTDSVQPQGFRGELPYSFWKQAESAPLVIVMPGLGGHRRTASVVSLAELAYESGNNVLVFSNTFNWEFIKSAPYGFYPGHFKEDSKIIITAYEAIYEKLVNKYGAKHFGSKKVVGMSMGAWYSLNFAAQFEQKNSKHKLDKCIAINPPINLIQGLNTLDNLFGAPAKGKTADEAKAIVRSALVKGLMSFRSGLKPTQALPFTDAEASYLIGMSFKFTLRELILEARYGRDIDTLTRKEEVYDDLNGYTFDDYFKRMVFPRLLDRGVPRNEILDYADLRNRADDLKKSSGIHLILSDNDFLLKEEQVKWFTKHFPDQHTLFEGGGHLGNTWQPRFKQIIKEQLKSN